jgi:exonuclease III
MRGLRPSSDVRTLNDSTSSQTISHKLLQITNGCKKHKIYVVAIQEHRLKTTNSDDINYITLNAWTLARTNSSHTSNGVTLLYSKRVSKALVAIERKSDRVIAMQLDGNPKICIISAHAPTEVSTDEKAKDDFYYELESLATSLPLHTINIPAIKQFTPINPD